MKTEIRKATQKDVGSIEEILNAATQKLLEKEIYQWEYPWNRRELELQADDFYIAESGGKSIGCFGLKKFENNTFTSDNSGMYFYHLAVHPDYNGKGIGGEICRWVQKFAAENSTNIYFDCWAGNEKLRSFYIGCGFEYLGDFPEEDYFVSAFRVKL